MVGASNLARGPVGGKQSPAESGSIFRYQADVASGKDEARCSLPMLLFRHVLQNHETPIRLD